MKSLLYKTIASLFFVSSLVFFGCSKKDNPAPAPGTSFSYTANNKNYTTSNQIIVPSGINQLSFSSLTLTGNNGYVGEKGKVSYNGLTYNYLTLGIESTALGDTSALFFTLVSYPDDIATGSYSILPLNLFKLRESFGVTGALGAYYSGVVTNKQPQAISSGSITITNIDLTNRKVTGTFSLSSTFTKSSAPTTVTISNGVFNNANFQQF